MGPCNRTREELDARLREAGYGKDADMFACFFRRSTAEEEAAEASKTAGSGAILCLSCGHSIGDHGGGTVVGTALGGTPAASAASADERPAEGAVAVATTGGDDDRAALLGGGESKEAAEEGADEECTPPLMAPGMTIKPSYDQLFCDHSGIKTKLFVVASVASIGYACHLISGFWDENRSFFASMGGCYLAFFGLAALIASLGAWYGSMFFLRIARLEEHEPSTAGAFGGRALWVDSVMQGTCGGDPDFSKHFKAKDVQSVQLDYNVASPGSAARIWLNMKPSQAPQAATNGTTTTTTSSATTTTTTTTTRGPAIVIFQGKCADPRGLAEAWREYLKPNAPQSLAHVDGLNR